MATTLASLQHAHSQSIQGILRVFIFIVTNTFFNEKKGKKREKKLTHDLRMMPNRNEKSKQFN